MPITVKHGEDDAGALAALALIMGAINRRAPELPQLPRPIPVDLGGGGGGYGRRGSSSPSMLVSPKSSGPTQEETLRTQMQARLKEQQFALPLEMEKLQAEAKAKAENWKFEYTAKQRQQIAQFNDARQQIQNNPRFSPVEKAAAIRQIDMQQANIKPSMMPADPNQFKWPEGTGPGMTWQDPGSGSLLSGEMDKDGQPIIKLIQRFDQGPEGMKLKESAAIQKEAIKAEQKRMEKLMDIRLQLATTPIEGSKDAKGNPVTRYRTPEEVNDMMQKIMGVQPQQQQQQLPVVKSDADFDALPPGAEFTDEEGNRFRKPGEQKRFW